MSDPFDLGRFVTAQDPVIGRVLEELRGGRKSSHWMWFVFPQIRGLGQSEMSRRYAISGRAEADAYLNHPLLSQRLIACTEALLSHADRTAVDILGAIDARKFQSSMTLFWSVRPSLDVFGDALQRFYRGEPDARTVSALETEETSR